MAVESDPHSQICENFLSCSSSDHCFRHSDACCQAISASPQSICSAEDFSSSFHALAIVWSSPGDIAMIQHVSAKSKRPRYPHPARSSHFCVGTYHRTSQLVCPGLPRTSPPHKDRLVALILCAEFPESQYRPAFTCVSEFLYSLIQPAISTGGTPMANVGLMISWCET